MKRLRTILLVTLLAMTVAACGDDDVSDLGGGQGTNVPGFGDDGFGDSSSLPTSVGNIPGLSSECEAYANLSLAMASVFSGGYDGFATDIVSQLPPEGRADGAIVADALQRFADGLAAADIDLSNGGMATLSAEQIEAFSAISEDVFNEDVEAAFDRLSDLVEAECAIGG